MNSPHERRVIFHLLKRPEDASLIEDQIRAEMFTDVAVRWCFEVLVYWRHHVGYRLTVDSALAQINQRVSVPETKSQMTEVILGLMNFEGSSRADLENSIAEIDRTWRRLRVLDLASKMAEKLIQAPDSTISEELHGLFEVTTPSSAGTFRSTRDSEDVSIRRFNEAKNAERTLGVQTGFPTIDKFTGGMRRGKLWTWMAFPGHGKTSTALDIAYNVAQAGGRVLICHLEMDETDLMAALHARRSHDVVEAIGRGLRPLSTRDVIDGKLDETQEKLLRVCIRDVAKLDIEIWVPGNASIADIRRRVNVAQISRKLDLVVIDYISLCKTPDQKGFGKRVDEQSTNFREAKAIARAEHVPLLALHQIKREAFEKALTRGFYLMSDGAETAEVERASDVVLWNLMTDDMRAAKEIKMGIAKNRLGEVMTEGFVAYTDLACGLVTERPMSRRPDFMERFMR